MITVALVDDYDVVLLGVARMLERYRDRVRVVEIDANEAVEDVVDVVLYDSFAQPESDQAEIAVLVANPRAHRVVVYTWNFHPDLVDSALRQGAHGYLSKTLTARELVLALEAVHAGEVVVSDPPPRARSALGLEWPGRQEGLTDREAEVLALITQGKSNAEVAALTCLSPNTVKSYIRNIYRKIDVAKPDPSRPLGRRPRIHPRPRPHRLLAHRGVIQPPLGRLHHSGPLGALNNSLADATAGHLLELVALVGDVSEHHREKRSGHLRTSQTAATAMSVLRYSAAAPPEGDRVLDQPVRKHPDPARPGRDQLRRRGGGQRTGQRRSHRRHQPADLDTPNRADYRRCLRRRFPQQALSHPFEPVAEPVAAAAVARVGAADMVDPVHAGTVKRASALRGRMRTRRHRRRITEPLVRSWRAAGGSGLRCAWPARARDVRSFRSSRRCG